MKLCCGACNMRNWLLLNTRDSLKEFVHKIRQWALEDDVTDVHALEAIVKHVGLPEFAGGAVRAVRQVEQLCEDERDRTREVAKLRLISSLDASAQRRFTKEQLQTTHNVTQRVRAVCLCPHSSLVNPGLVAVIASAAVTASCGGVQTVPRRRGTRGRGGTFKTKVGIT